MNNTYSESYLNKAISDAYLLGVKDVTDKITDSSIKLRDFVPLIEKINRDIHNSNKEVIE